MLLGVVVYFCDTLTFRGTVDQKQSMPPFKNEVVTFAMHLYVRDDLE